VSKPSWMQFPVLKTHPNRQSIEDHIHWSTISQLFHADLYSIKWFWNLSTS
jgi:glutaredoxin-related protein